MIPSSRTKFWLDTQTNMRFTYSIKPSVWIRFETQPLRNRWNCLILSSKKLSSQPDCKTPWAQEILLERWYFYNDRLIETCGPVKTWAMTWNDLISTTRPSHAVIITLFLSWSHRYYKEQKGLSALMRYHSHFWELSNFFKG